MGYEILRLFALIGFTICMGAIVGIGTTLLVKNGDPESTIVIPMLSSTAAGLGFGLSGLCIVWSKAAKPLISILFIIIILGIGYLMVPIGMNITIKYGILIGAIVLFLEFISALFIARSILIKNKLSTYLLIVFSIIGFWFVKIIFYFAAAFCASVVSTF
jgi:hypothetical protein